MGFVFISYELALIYFLKCLPHGFPHKMPEMVSEIIRVYVDGVRAIRHAELALEMPFKGGAIVWNFIQII